MANEKVISTQALIEKFRYALDNDWGYIWGKAGQKWTQAQQDAATREMTVKYGQKWVGHYVADCSGLFYWAFKQLGSYMYHGSDTMFRKYCTANGTLNNGQRTDGMTLKPGTAVFTWKPADGKYGHVGLFVGDGKVIEAKGTQAGVVTSKVTDKRWTHWGELKNVDYGADQGIGDPAYYEPGTVWRSTIRKGDKGEDVRYVQTILYNLGYDLGKYGIDGDFGSATQAAVKEFQRDNKLNPDGVVGPLTYEALEKANRKPVPVEKFYMVCIHHLDKTQADALKNNYPGATVTEE